MKFTGIQRREGYVTLHTAALNDPALSFKAKGLFALLCAWTPDQPLTISALERLSNDGRFVVETAWDELEKAGYITTRKGEVTLHENCEKQPRLLRETPKANTANTTPQPVNGQGETATGFLEKLPKGAPDLRRNSEKVDVLIKRKTAKKRASVSEKFAKDPDHALDPIQQQVNKKESICISDAVVVEPQPGKLYFAADAPERTALMRNTPVGDFGVFKQMREPRELEAMGVDIEHYHRTILRWSDKKARTLRTAQGWVSTILGAMERDKNENKLRMHDTEQNDNEALSRFLNIGR